MLAGRQPEGMERSGIPSGEHGASRAGAESPVPPSDGYRFGGGDLTY